MSRSVILYDTSSCGNRPARKSSNIMTARAAAIKIIFSIMNVSIYYLQSVPHAVCALGALSDSVATVPVLVAAG